jgi:hypothetical protein
MTGRCAPSCHLRAEESSTRQVPLADAFRERGWGLPRSHLADNAPLSKQMTSRDTWSRHMLAIGAHGRSGDATGVLDRDDHADEYAPAQG